MHIQSGIVKILQIEPQWAVSVEHLGAYLALNTNSTLKEAVEVALANKEITQLIRNELEAILAKGNELKWNESDMVKAFLKKNV